jgi:hypothetical protein
MNDSTMGSIPTPVHDVTAGIVAVGEARGFVVEVQYPINALLRAGDATPPEFDTERMVTERMIVTAAHCFWHLFPPVLHPHPHPLAADERTDRWVGPRDSVVRFPAECVFIDRVADVAIVCAPDSQDRRFGPVDDDDIDESAAFAEIVDSATPLRIGDLPTKDPAEAWLLTLAGTWVACLVHVGVDRFGRSLTLLNARTGNQAGCSGSPIVGADGRAIGLISCGGSDGLHGDEPKQDERDPLQPRLAHALPRWFLDAAARAEAR